MHAGVLIHLDGSLEVESANQATPFQCSTWLKVQVLQCGASATLVPVWAEGATKIIVARPQGADGVSGLSVRLGRVTLPGRPQRWRCGYGRGGRFPGVGWLEIRQSG